MTPALAVSAPPPAPSLALVALVALVILVVLLACLLAGALARNAPPVVGGAPRPGSRAARAARSENLVVDTLNLAHWLRRGEAGGPINICDILSAIDAASPALRARFPGKIIFVTKERERPGGPAEKAGARRLYQAAAERNGVHLSVVERLPGPRGGRAHAALGRDDFYLALTAWKLRCGVLSRDRFRDLGEMQRGALDPFHVFLFSPHRAGAGRDFVNPAAPELKKMRRPFLFAPEDVLPGL